MKANSNTNGFVLFLKIYFMCMCVLPPCTYTYRGHAWCPWGPKVGVVSPGSGVRDGFQLPCRCLELNLGPLGDSKCS